MGFGKDGKGEIIRESRLQALGALAAADAILIGTKLPTTEDFRIIKSEIVCDITGLTAGEGKGLALYLADGVYDATQVEASIEGIGPLGPNEAVEAEIAMRFNKWFGEVVVQDPAATVAIPVNETGGALLSQTVRWTFSRTKSWNWVIYNHGTVLTTGATAIIRAKNYGVWVR